MLTQSHFTINTPGRGFILLTEKVQALVNNTQIQTGLCHVFLHHTSASLILSENADHLVQQDLEAFMQRLIPDGDPLCQHIEEGPDDMPSHVRAVLTQSFVMIPVTEGVLALGRWQGIYLWEHRLRSHERKLTITVQGS